MKRFNVTNDFIICKESDEVGYRDNHEYQSLVLLVPWEKGNRGGR